MKKDQQLLKALEQFKLDGNYKIINYNPLTHFKLFEELKRKVQNESTTLLGDNSKLQTMYKHLKDGCKESIPSNEYKAYCRLWILKKS